MASTLTASIPESAPERATRRIVVAHLLHTIAYGGPETIILNWLGAQDRSKFDIHLLCFTDPKGSETPFVVAAKKANLPVVLIPWNRSKPVLRSSRQLASYLRENKVDILHCYNTYAELVGVVAKRSYGVRLVTTKWMWGKLDWKRAVLQQLERLMLSQFDRVTAQSEFAAKLTDGRGMKGRPVEVLMSGLKQPLYPYGPEERDQARAVWSAGPENFVFLHLARFWPEKAHDVLVKSFRQVIDQEPRCRLWLAGVGPLLEPTRELVHRLGLDDQVQFIGFQADLARLLPLVDAQIHSSNIEGIPLALCSGLSAGLPVVATSVGGVPEIIEDGVTGLLVPPDDPAALAQAASRILRDPQLRSRVGVEAARFMKERYSLKAAMTKLEALYAEMMAQ
jgi:glycosyltransferase involved in cell wall biosynthesis